VGGDATWSGSGWFNGRLDEVAVYPTVLSGTQVANHYALGTGGGTVNNPPTASFTTQITDLTVDATSTSQDSDGTIASTSWNWGDGTPATTGTTSSHTYATAGQKTITLTVTDNDGATGTVSHQVTVTAPAQNQAPTAAFTWTADARAVTFDASGSHDDAAVTDYAWDYGDGSAVEHTTSPTVVHTFPSAATYPVTLTVSDAQSLTGSTEHDVAVSDTPGPQVFVSDTFGRTVDNGLGTADQGGSWTVSQGGTRQNVRPGGGNLTLPAANNNTGSNIGSGIGDVDLTTSFSLDVTPTGSGTYAYVTTRRVSTNNELRVRVRVLPTGQVAVALSRLTTSGTTVTEAFPAGETTLAGVTYTAGQTLNIRIVQTGTGSGTLSLATEVWTAGGTEPASPQVTYTDSTAVLQTPGNVGILAHRPSGTTAATTVKVTAFRATAVQ
jgi:PKD repeat protein